MKKLKTPLAALLMATLSASLGGCGHYQAYATPFPGVTPTVSLDQADAICAGRRSNSRATASVWAPQPQPDPSDPYAGLQSSLGTMAAGAAADRANRSVFAGCMAEYGWEVEWVWEEEEF